jgi:hypothetical protein
VKWTAKNSVIKRLLGTACGAGWRAAQESRAAALPFLGALKPTNLS